MRVVADKHRARNSNKMSNIFRMPVKLHPWKDQSHQSDTDQPNLRKSEGIHNRKSSELRMPGSFVSFKDECSSQHKCHDHSDQISK